MIDAVSLDVGGTLLDGGLQEELFRRKLTAYLRKLGYSLFEEEVKRSINSAKKDLIEVRKKNLEMRFEDFYTKVLLQLGITPTDEILANIWKMYVDSFSYREKNGVREVLKALYGKFKLAIISNTMSGASKVFLKQINLIKYFDVIVTSADIGIRKPDPRIFHYALKRLNIEPSRAVHIGDSLEEDVLGAKNARMKAIWISNGAPSKADIAIPDLIVKSIADVPKLIKTLDELH